MLLVNSPDAENILFLFKICFVSNLKDYLYSSLFSFLILSIDN